jgi:TPR repeat protein
MKLGVLYVSGLFTEELHVTPDVVEAYKWFSLAANAGESKALEEKTSLEAHLTPEQRAEAEKRVKDWKPTTASPETEAPQ